VAISSKLLTDGERVVLSTRTHVKALIVPLLVLILLLAVGVVLANLLDDKAGGIPTLIVWIVVALGVIWYVVRPVLVWLSATYTVTNRRLITRSGVLTRRGHDIPLSRISDVASERGVLDRMLGCGTLIVSDASTDGRVLLHDIPRVEDVQREINELLHAPDGGNDGT
jgi:membrane protein YdbS with pleckstrin-like domain